jgi:predicted PurR-regulated permease PerM
VREGVIYCAGLGIQSLLLLLISRPARSSAVAPRRAVLTPSLGHMPLWAVLLALLGGTAVFGFLGARTFRNRAIN